MWSGRQRGAAALLALIFGMVMVFAVSAIASLAAVHMKAAVRTRQRAAARAAAESGIAASLAALVSGRSGSDIAGDISGARYNARWSGSNAGFTVESTGVAQRQGSPAVQWSVRLTGRFEGSTPIYTRCRADGTVRRER
jgi:hypothetical protein